MSLPTASTIPSAVLCLLYRKRGASPDFVTLSLLDMEILMAFAREKLLFAIWCLSGSQLPSNQMLYKIFRASDAGLMVYPKPLASKAR